MLAKVSRVQSFPSSGSIGTRSNNLGTVCGEAMRSHAFNSELRNWKDTEVRSGLQDIPSDYITKTESPQRDPQTYFLLKTDGPRSAVSMHYKTH